jgi:hypothetical protein
MRIFAKSCSAFALFANWLCLSIAQSDPNLQSQKWINVLNAGKTGTFSEYQFDEKGLVIQKKNYTGLDKLGKLTSQTDYSYDTQKRLIFEKTTLSDALNASVQYQYASSIHPTVIIHRSGKAVEKFRDSLFYTSEGLLREQRCYKANVMIVMHRFGYQVGRLIIDTTFENDGLTLVPKQGLWYAYDQSNRIFEERKIQWINGKEYISYTKAREYNVDGTLSKVKEYVGKGSSAALISSVSYLYNNQAQRFREEVSNGTGNLVSATEYSWVGGVSAIRNISKNDESNLAIKQIQGQFIPTNGRSLRLLDLRGRVLYSSQDLANGRSIRLTAPAILTLPKSSTHPQTSRSH